MDQPMKRNFKKSFVSYPDCRYKDLAYGTIYYVAGTKNTALNAYVGVGLLCTGSETIY
jgi:hypothetical protein